jgi:tetratricopeptide (TPR) repeat protein
MHHELGQYDEAVRHGEAALALYERITDIPGEAAVTGNLGLTFSEQGRLDEAITYLEKSVELFTRSGDRFYAALSVQALGKVHRRADDLPAARSALRQALSLYEELRHPEAERIRAELEVIG